MKTVRAIPYLSPAGLARPIPLERFLPNCPVNIIGSYLAEDPQPDKWAFDPFGSNPLLALEAAGVGKVLVACNNPVLVFLLKMLAAPAPKEDYLAVLSELASQMRGNERLETHIKGVYQTRCAICHTLIQAEGYLWKRNESVPYARVYRCPHCGDEGERAITEEDLAIFQPLQRGEPIHRARALSRVLMGSEEDRPAVEEALKVYNPRALYVLFTLLNKLEGMRLEAQQRLLSEAMMISLLDAGTALWSWPDVASQPRQLTLSPVYFEKNLWNELERCADLWSQPVPTIDLTLWPELPTDAGICLFPGPVRAIEKLPAGMEIDRLICLPPRPNQAFWTLSALWSAWLWGKEQTSHSFNQVLGRRRFDWHWHTLALQQALKKAVALAPQCKEIFIQIGEPSTGMVYAVCAAGSLGGLQLDGLAMREADAPIQMRWQLRNITLPGSKANPQATTRQAIRAVLQEVGEPVPYLVLYTAAVSALTINDGWPASLREFKQEKSSLIQGTITALFGERGFLQRFEATSQEPESGKWGLANWRGALPPLADRVEEVVVEQLRSENQIAAAQLSSILNHEFPGWMTPPADLVEFCLTSYADWDAAAQSWNLRSKEIAQNRQADLHQARQRILKLGKKLHYECCDEESVVWKDDDVEAYRFYFSDLATVHRFMRVEDENEPQSVLVLPGSRAALLKFKLMRDPHLREPTAHGWHFLKLRALQVLAARTDLSRSIWEMQLDSDPINLEETTQLRIFG